MPNENEITRHNNLMLQTTVGEYQEKLFSYLVDLGLPTENVLVDVDQRGMVIQTVPKIIKTLSFEKRSESFYISKFIAACGAGLFDSALNYLWDETIENLRNKVFMFDLEYFKSTIKDEKKRSEINTIEDLSLIDDWGLVRGCHVTGIISSIGFKQLDFIRYMRNWASAAHPNQVQLTGLQLCSWLETCNIEVIGKEPSLPAIEAKRLLQNIRNNDLKDEDIPPIKAAFIQAPSDIISSIFKTTFGMFCDPNLKVEIKNNIRLIANTLWEVLPEEQRKEVGLKNAHWAANADITRKNLSREFMEQVNALSYLTEDTRILELSNSIELLQNAHFGNNNFYNEPPYAKILRKLIPENGNIPDSVRFRYVKIICLCMIGNGYGISTMAYPFYEELFNKFTFKETKEYIKLFCDGDINSRLQFSKCVLNYRNLLSILKNRTTDNSIISVIEYIELQSDLQLQKLSKTSRYNQLIKLLS